MDRDRVMNANLDALASEVLLQGVAAVRANDVKMPHRFGATGFARQNDSASLQMLLIEVGVPAPRRVPLFQVFQFDPQNRGLHGVEPPVVAAEKVLVFFLLPVVPQHFEALGNLAVIGDHDAAIAVSSQIFPGVKTKRDRKSTRLNSSHITISYAVF